MGGIEQGLEHALRTRPVPSSTEARLRFLLATHRHSTRRVAAVLGVSQRTVQRWVTRKPGARRPPGPLQVRAIEEAVLARWQPRIRARGRAQAEAEGFVFHTRARFGFAAPAGSSDDPRVRWITQYLPGEVARDLFAARDAVPGIAARLVDIVTTGPQAGLTGSDPVKEALGALGALDGRLPAEAAQQVLPLLVEWIPREPNTYRFTDEQMLSFLGACIRAELPVADQAVQALLEAWKLDVNGAEGLLAGLGAQLSAAVPVVRERAQAGHRGATALLASWQVDDPSVTETARELANTVLAEPVGTVRPFYSMGTTARQCAAFLMACSDDQSTVGTVRTEPTRLMRERVAAHLLLWAEDRSDTADRRSEAARALSILAETLPAPVRDDMFERLMGLYQDPGEHPSDAFERRTQHPLSRFKINKGSDWRLPTEILHAAAVFATTTEQALRVEQRLLPQLTRHEQKQGRGWLQAQTVRALDPLAPAQTSLIATHPSPFLRQTAVICWGRAAHRDPDLARVFAKDSDTGVRHNLAHTLTELPPEERPKYRAITEQLRTDNSARVRQAAAQIP
ncbi:telomere-protecting terminal protein Tpg [Streptomyces sp. NPDC056291]|uniref:telomere-protecting terminal protein Tpg n=1 Tax=Streptomyces sp. NPDC056291 TaxID=3345772 RepID=UPI0035D94DD7